MIDADKILGRLLAWNTSDDVDKTLRRFTLGRIIEQPTAYDIGKVVEQLKTDSSVKLYGSGNINNYLISLEKAIEIVKAGGINE